MSDDASDNPDSSGDGGTAAPGEVPENVQESIQKGRERLEKGADRAVDSFDEGIVDLLSWVLDTETRARIYVYLRQHPNSTSEEIAKGTGLYPSTVREALAELTDEDKVSRQKRESEGAGNNPYEYEAIPPSDLVGSVVQDVQKQLNTVIHLDSYLGDDEAVETDSDPVTISVEEADDPEEPGTDEVPVPDDEDDVEEPGTGEEVDVPGDEDDDEE